MAAAQALAGGSIVVLVAISPSIPACEDDLGDLRAFLAGEIGGHLDEQRRRRSGRIARLPRRVQQTRRVAARRCRARRPGVFGDETLTTR